MTNRSIIAICQEFTGLFYVMSPFLVIGFELLYNLFKILFGYINVVFAPEVKVVFDFIF